MDYLNLRGALKVPSTATINTDNRFTTTEFLLSLEKNVNELLNSVDNHNVEQFNKIAEALKKQIDSVKNEVSDKNILSTYETIIKDMISSNINERIGDGLKLITFELDKDGYLVANVPEAYEALNFLTDSNPDSDNYGKLVLEY